MKYKIVRNKNTGLIWYFKTDNKIFKNFIDMLEFHIKGAQKWYILEKTFTPMQLI